MSDKPPNPNDKPSVLLNIACLLAPLLILLIGDFAGWLALAVSPLAGVLMIIFLLSTRKSRARLEQEAGLCLSCGLILWGAGAFLLFAAMDK